ncbi:MAG: hypothetical protein E6J34_14345 [Chloroflexi bacterium]|nr:MAG: hypothetical protein E6J34_14345 [Chloroflexota bacterium]
MSPEDPAVNDHIMYAKCVKGHVLKDANDWVLCENLPASDAKCWMEGGDTVFSLQARERSEANRARQAAAKNGLASKKAVPSRTSKA